MLTRDRARILIIKSLQEIVFWAKTSYYDGHSAISDENYDIIEDQLRKVCPDHPLLIRCVGIPDENMLLGIVELKELLGLNEGNDEN